MNNNARWNKILKDNRQRDTLALYDALLLLFGASVASTEQSIEIQDQIDKRAYRMGVRKYTSEIYKS